MGAILMLLCMAEDNGGLGLPQHAGCIPITASEWLYRVQRSQTLRDDGNFVEGFGMIGWTGTGYLAP